MYPLCSNPKVDTRLDKQEASRTIESYLDFYNNERPHMSLRFMTPAEFLLQYSQRNSKVQNVVSEYTAIDYRQTRRYNPASIG